MTDVEVAREFLLGQGASPDLVEWTLRQPDTDLASIVQAAQRLPVNVVTGPSGRSESHPVRPPKFPIKWKEVQT